MIMIHHESSQIIQIWPEGPPVACSGVLADAGTPRPVSGQNFQKKKIPKNIKSGLKQVAVPPFEAISSGIDAGAPPAPFSQESGSLGPKRAQNL